MAPSTLHFYLIKGPHLTSKPTQRFWQKCPTKFRSGEFWSTQVLKIKKFRNLKADFVSKMKRNRARARYVPSPPMGFPEILVGKVHLFFWWDSDAQNESIHHVLGVRFLAKFPSGNLDISVFLAGYVSSLESAHTLPAIVPARWRWIHASVDS